jgi:hypothetical protein
MGSTLVQGECHDVRYELQGGSGGCELCMAATHTEKECAQRGTLSQTGGTLCRPLNQLCWKQPPMVSSPGAQALGHPAEPCRTVFLLMLPIPSSVCSICGGDHPATHCHSHLLGETRHELATEATNALTWGREISEADLE